MPLQTFKEQTKPKSLVQKLESKSKMNDPDSHVRRKHLLLSKETT